MKKLTVTGRINRYFRMAAGAIPLALLFACVEQQSAKPFPPDRFAEPFRPPLLAAKTPEETASASAAVRDVSSYRFNKLPGTRMISVTEIPWLLSAPEGAAFTALALPRALARGEPAPSCPAAAAATGADRSSAAGNALSACIQSLDKKNSANQCGCKLLAVDDVLLAPLKEFSYAPVISALLISDGQALRLVADAVNAPEAQGQLVALRTLNGVVGILLLEGESARLELADGSQWSGVRKSFGYRRGQIAERVRLTGADGAKASILLGVSADDAFAG